MPPRAPRFIWFPCPDVVPSMFDFGETPVLMEGAYLTPRRWVRESRIGAGAMSVIVVTDSAASLPSGARPNDWASCVVPMTLVLGGLVYADGDLSPEELVARAAHESVSTSAPSPGAFLKAVASATEHEESGGQVVILTVSSAMSATYEVARVAAGYVDDAEVRVIDTGTAAGAQGLGGHGRRRIGRLGGAARRRWHPSRDAWRRRGAFDGLAAQPRPPGSFGPGSPGRGVGGAIARVCGPCSSSSPAGCGPDCRPAASGRPRAHGRGHGPVPAS